VTNQITGLRPVLALSNTLIYYPLQANQFDLNQSKVQANPLIKRIKVQKYPHGFFVHKTAPSLYYNPPLPHSLWISSIFRDPNAFYLYARKNETSYEIYVNQPNNYQTWAILL
jgi:hypothetical protein